MGITAEIALASANTYTEETVIGGGAIKGANCKVQSISSITGGHRVTFKWTLDDGTEQTGYMDVMDGADGKDGVDGKDGKDGVDGTVEFDDLTPEQKAELKGDTGATGPQGPQGPAGKDGKDGTNGQDGAPGVGVPTGGTSGQVLAKKTGTDFDTEWVNQSGGGGGGINYSTSEQDTGLKWIDGKKVYQKTFDCSTLPSSKNQSLDILHGISNLDTVISIVGIAKSSAAQVPIVFAASGAQPAFGTQITITINATTMSIFVGQDRSNFVGFVTLQYTKS